MMLSKQQKICGIVGGVGPSATVDLFRLIIKNTPVKRDQDHLRILIDNYPQIPDRTEAILNNAETPVPYMLESVKLLKNAGANFLVCPCNTAHYFLNEVEKEVGIPFINMIEETAREIVKCKFRKVGLLSTAGTVKVEIYQKELKKRGVVVVIPSKNGIEKETEAIYGPEGIKAGTQYEKSLKNKQLFKEVIEEMKTEGIEAVIIGCTEIPLCLDENDTDLPLINPTEILAKAVVGRCR